MAITTLNGVIAGARAPEDILKAQAGQLEAVGVWLSLAYTSGQPGQAVGPTPGLAGAALTTYPGQIPFTNPAAGESTYVSRLVASASQAGTLRLYDRLWHNSGVNVSTTTAQTISSVAWPARDRAGSVNGVGVGFGLEVQVATSNGAAVTTITASYTSSDGTAGRTATMTSFPASANAGTFVPFSLQAGDVGVRSIQSITLGTSLLGGTIHLVAYRTLATLPLPQIGVAAELNAVTGGMPQLYNDTVPFLLWMSNNVTGPNIFGQLSYAQG